MLRICLGGALFFLAGCAMNHVYVNPAKTSSQTEQDARGCQDKAAVAAPELHQKEFDGCMTGLGYKAMSESAAKKVRGFSRSWVSPEVDFKAYQAAFIEPVDTSMAVLKDLGRLDILHNKRMATPEEAAELAARMHEAFSQALGGVLKVETDRAALAGQKAMVVKLALDSIQGSDPAGNLAAELFLGTSVLHAKLSMSCTINDAATGEPLITLSDKHKSGQGDANTSYLGKEAFSRWQGARLTIDLWADRLAGLLDAKRGVPHKSPFKKHLL